MQSQWRAAELNLVAWASRCDFRGSLVTPFNEGELNNMNTVCVCVCVCVHGRAVVMPPSLGGDHEVGCRTAFADIRCHPIGLA